MLNYLSMYIFDVFYYQLIPLEQRVCLLNKNNIYSIKISSNANYGAKIII